MNIKAQGLINAAKWIEAEYGTRELERVLAQCSEVIRERIEFAITIEWHPMGEFIEFLEAVEQVLGNGDGGICESIGEHSARLNTRGFVKRAVFYVAGPNFLLKRVASSWSQFNDEGSMRMLHMDDCHTAIEIVGVPSPNRLFCAVLTGWSRVICQAVGFNDPVIQHEPCRARGAQRCVWNVRWSVARQDRAITHA